MADYDSDSSLSDAENDDISTAVLLGYASKEPTVDEFSQLGGLPTWLDGTTLPDGRLANCGICNSVLCLYLQLNADLPDWFPGHERRLYVFGCRKKACRRKNGSVRALRGVRVHQLETTVGAEEKVEEKAKVNLGETLFGAKSPTPAQANPFSTSTAGGVSANPFASPSGSASSSNPFSTATSTTQPQQSKPDTMKGLAETFAQKARISNPAHSSDQPPQAPPEPWPTDPKPYTSFHIDAATEYVDPTFGTDVVPTTARVETNGESSGSSAAEDKALFESTMDKTFQRFADRLAQNPEQVLRYEFGGQPLLYSKNDAVGKLLAPATDARVQTSSSSNGVGSAPSKLPRCANCGAARVFELQLTPHAISELEADDPAIDGMEWGTIIVGVCSEDCQQKGKATSEVGYAEEWVGVQWEEIADHRPR